MSKPIEIEEWLATTLQPTIEKEIIEIAPDKIDDKNAIIDHLKERQAHNKDLFESQKELRKHINYLKASNWNLTDNIAELNNFLFVLNDRININSVKISEASILLSKIYNKNSIRRDIRSIIVAVIVSSAISYFIGCHFFYKKNPTLSSIIHMNNNIIRRQKEMTQELEKVENTNSMQTSLIEKVYASDSTIIVDLTSKIDSLLLLNKK